MTFLAASRSFLVRFPVPRPISRTTSVGLTPDFCTIESTSKGFLRMCWPLDLWKEIPPWYGMCCCAFVFSFFIFPPAIETRCTVSVQRAHTSAHRNTEWPIRELGFQTSVIVLMHIQKKHRKRVNIKIVPATKEIFLVVGPSLPSAISTNLKESTLSASLTRAFSSKSHRREWRERKNNERKNDPKRGRGRKKLCGPKMEEEGGRRAHKSPKKRGYERGC